MPEFMEDQLVWPHMLALRNCLCEEIERSGLPSVCFCEVVPGSAAMFDYPEGGQAWVRLTQAFPSVVFPVQDTNPRGNCGTGLVAVLEVGIIRCAPMPSDGGDMPTAQEQFEATRLQMADMQAIRRAIQCCMGKMKHVLGAYTPIGPDGNAVGGSWTVSI